MSSATKWTSTNNYARSRIDSYPPLLYVGGDHISICPLCGKTFSQVHSEDSRFHRLGDATRGIWSGEMLNGREQVIDTYNATFDAFRTVYVNENFKLRFRSHRAYRQLSPSCSGQRFYVLQGVTSGGDELESEMWFHHATLEEEEFVTEMVSTGRINIISPGR
jgi:hypothetical protein